MTRNLKALGLALVAVLALGALTASAASAQGKLTSDTSQLVLDTTETGAALENSFTAFSGQVVDCTENTYHAEASTPTSTVSVAPTYKNCTAGGNFATVTMNGCEFVFHIGAGVGGHTTWSTTTDLVCPPNKDVEVHVYSSSSEVFQICKITIQPQNASEFTFDNLHFTNTDGAQDSTDDIDLAGTVTSITASRTGFCGATTDTNAVYHVDVTIEGTDKKGNHNGIRIST